MLTKEQIAGIADLKTEVVHVPEWGGDVTMRALSGAGRAAWLESLNPDPDFAADAKLVAQSLIDETGAPMFTAEEVLQHSAGVIRNLAAVAGRLSGLTPQAVGDAEKNSDSPANGVSISASPGTSVAQ